MPEGKHPSSHLVLATLPGAVMAIVATVDLTAGPEVGFLPLVSLGPAFAGLVGTWRRTAVIGAVALLLCTALGIYDGLLDSRRGYTALASVGGVTAAGVTAAVMRGRRESELATMRSIAEVAQRVLLRPVPRTAGSLRIAVSYTSAVADARIGGDLYEVVATPHGVRVIVGDVQGKGLAAVESAAVVLGAFREAAHDEPDLLALGARLDRSISRDLNSEKFVTAVLAEVGPEEGRAVFLNYGHPPPLILHRDGGVHFPQPPSYALPLGLSGMHGGNNPQPFSVGFTPGEQILLYTDGISEARDADGSFYPLGDRAALLRTADAQNALDLLREDVAQHSDGLQHDDAALLLLRYHAHTEAAGSP